LFFETGSSHYETKAGLELVICIPGLPNCWHHSCVPLHPAVGCRFSLNFPQRPMC
jgi:hypothetical protein